jgi:hypothetical protein
MSKVLDIARKEIGTTEDPPDSNRTKYGEWFSYQGVPWCAIFVSWCFYRAGLDLPKIGFSKPGFAGCQSAVAYFRKTGRIVNIPKPGDIAFYDFNGDGRYEHTGLYEAHLSTTMFTAIEGNTSVSNDSNGGQVMRRKRLYRKAIFVRP